MWRLKALWSYFTGPNNEAAENPAQRQLIIQKHHLDAQYMLDRKCPAWKHNLCKYNPRCVTPIVEKYWSADEPPRMTNNGTETRDNFPFSGLRNIRFLCYCNSIIQLWYNNHNFRAAVLNWNPAAEGPDSVLSQMQLLFAEMEVASRRGYAVDPSNFTKVLKLDANAQEDPQEFFMQFLNRDESYIRENLSQNFMAEVMSVIKCCKCDGVVTKSTTMLNLQLPVTEEKQNLVEMIQSTFAEEKLEHENQYNCETCNQKCDAFKHQKFTKLPPTLIFHVLRYKWDSIKEETTKLTSTIEIPHYLKMSPFVAKAGAADCTDSTAAYKLSAVVVHRGENTGEGHYTVNLRDKGSGKWFNISDSSIKIMHACDLMEEASTEMRKPDLDTLLFSDCAYMIAYESIDQKEMPCKPPAWLENYIKNKNKELEVKEEQIKSEKELRNSQWKHNKAYMMGFMKGLSANVEDSGEFIPLEWLMTWAEDPQTKVPINNRAFVCPHNKVAFSKVCDMRLIDTKAADCLFSVYKGGPRLALPDYLCGDCVSEKISNDQDKEKIDEDAKRVLGHMEVAEKSSGAKWISAFYLRSWRLLAEIGKNEEFLSSVTGCSIGFPEPKKRKIDFSCANNVILNQDINCLHNKMCKDEASRCLCPDAVWNIINQYFPQAITFTSDSEPCDDCSVMPIDTNVLLPLAKNLKESVPHIDVPMRVWDYKVEDNKPRFYLPEKFACDLRNFMQHPLSQPLPEFDVTEYSCQHGLKVPLRLEKLLQENPEQLLTSSLVSEIEWEVIKMTVKTSGQIKISGQPGDFASEPAECLPCIMMYSSVDIMIHWDLSGVHLKPWLTSYADELEYFEVRMDQDDTLGSLKEKVADVVLAYLIDDVQLCYHGIELLGNRRILREFGLKKNCIVECTVKHRDQSFDGATKESALVFTSSPSFSGTF